MTDQAPATEAGRRLDERIAYYEDPPRYWPGDWIAEVRADIIAIEAEARASAPECRCQCYGCRSASHDDD